MKRTQTKAKLFKTTRIGLALASTLLLVSQVNPLKAEAQQANTGSSQDILLPPEVVPSSQYSASSMSSAPGLISNPAEAATQPAGQMQSAQDFRKALMDSLAGKGNYPQFNGSNPYGNQFAQNNNQFVGQPQNNQSFANQGQPPLGQGDWMTPNQDNTLVNANPPQTQTLTGPVRSMRPPYQGGNSYAHTLGNAASLGATIYSGALSGGQGYYGLGYTGAGLLNYGYQNGFKGF
jgi:hypothetical protein